jgi:hypothetical protein
MNTEKFEHVYHEVLVEQCKKELSENPESYHYSAKMYDNRELAIFAIQKLASNFKYVSPTLREDIEIIKMAVKADPNLLLNTSDTFLSNVKNADYIVSVIMKKPSIVHELYFRLYDNKTPLKLCLSFTPNLFGTLPEPLRNDFDLAVSACLGKQERIETGKQNKTPLNIEIKDASSELKQNYKFSKISLKNTGFSYRFLSKAMRSRPDITRMAQNKGIGHLVNMGNSLIEHPEVYFRRHYINDMNLLVYSFPNQDFVINLNKNIIRNNDRDFSLSVEKECLKLLDSDPEKVKILLRLLKTQKAIVHHLVKDWSAENIQVIMEKIKALKNPHFGQLNTFFKSEFTRRKIMTMEQKPKNKTNKLKSEANDITKKKVRKLKF